jgi:hypothetical protein
MRFVGDRHATDLVEQKKLGMESFENQRSTFTFSP